MQDTGERVRRVELRAKELRRKRESRQIAGLGFLSGLMVIFLAGSFYALTGDLQGSLQGDSGSRLFGAMLLYENAGGYVLAAVLSFAAAVVITVLCIKHKNKNEKCTSGSQGEDRK